MTTETAAWPPYDRAHRDSARKPSRSRARQQAVVVHGSAPPGAVRYRDVTDVANAGGQRTGTTATY